MGLGGCSKTTPRANEFHKMEFLGNWIRSDNLAPKGSHEEIPLVNYFPHGNTE